MKLFQSKAQENILSPSVSYLTSQRLADRLGIAEQTLRNWRVAGYGPSFVKVGRLVRYPLDGVLAWEAQRTVTSTTVGVR